MRELKEIHLYPREGFNDIKFGDSSPYIRNIIGDPYCTISSPDTDYFISIYNGGNLELYFRKSTMTLMKIRYDINLPSKTRFYMRLDAVSSYLPNIMDWITSSKESSLDKLHMEIEEICDLQKRRKKVYLIMNP